MKTILISLAALSASLLTACAGYVPFPVSDGERDTMNLYDGRWSMEISARSRIPVKDERKFVCEIAEDTALLVVEDGVARLENMPSEYTTNVARNGEFRLEIPTDENLRRRSGFSGINSELTLVYKGTLSDDESTGVFVHARGASQVQDCSTTMSITKL